jgi:pimeloyl-ACP methyl ester carboxylesterase
VSEAVFESVKRLERDGFVLEYGVAGPADGPVLLLLHAIRNTRLLFAGIVPRLAEGYRVIAPDLRGHGSSSRQGPYTFERIAEDIRLHLDAEGVEQTVIAAASFSAVPAQLFAARYPARVSRLVLLDGGFYRLGEMPGFDRAAVVDRLARTRFVSLTEAEEQFARRYGTHAVPAGLAESEPERKEDGRYGYKLPAEAFDAYFREYASFDRAGLFGALACPVLLLLADEEMLPDEAQRRFFREAAAEYARMVPQARCEKIDGSLHLLMVTHPRETAERMVQFLACAR